MPDNLTQNPGSRREGRPVAAPAAGSGSLLAGVIVIAVLYFAREIFVPLSLAVLFSFALGPLTLLLRRWHFGRVPSVVAAVSAAFLVIAGIAALIGSQVTRLAENLWTSFGAETTLPLPRTTAAEVRFRGTLVASAEEARTPRAASGSAATPRIARALAGP